MTHNEFIEKVAEYVKKYAPQYGIKVHSPIIAQACLESAYGTSELAKVNNYFGLKYRANRCPGSNGTYQKIATEQNADGSYYQKTTDWFKFPDMESGIKGYFDFINISNYSNLKGVTDPETYLNNIKADKYATSLLYVSNLMGVIKSNDLTRFDPTEAKSEAKSDPVGGNSGLVSYTKLVKNYTPMTNKVNKKITIHHMAGNLTVESCANCFNGDRQASSNYGIGSDGRIGLYVEEKNRSWASSSSENDSQAVTIEVANDTLSPIWSVSAKAMESLINLCVDICKRNKIDKLIYTGDKSGNLTIHKFFKATLCPGPYLEARLVYIADEVNKRLGGVVEEIKKPTDDTFLVKVEISDLNIRKGPSAKTESKGYIKPGIYTIVDTNGSWGRLKSGAGWICLNYAKRL